MSVINPLAPLQNQRQKGPSKADVYQKLAQLEYQKTMVDPGSTDAIEVDAAIKQLNDFLKLPEEEQFQPKWDAIKTRQMADYHSKTPHAFNKNQIEELKQHAEYHGVPFFEGEFDLKDALWQAVGGFVEGFTTLNFVEEPDNKYEKVIRDLSHLAGFAPGILAGPAKMLGASQGTLGMLKALGQKSVPMAGANWITKKAKGITKPMLSAALTKRGEGVNTVSNFLLGNRARHIAEGAFHLGVASSISSWQGGVDEMMASFVGGAQAGAVFRGIGNLFKHDPANGAKAVKTMAGSLFMGLPETMRGATDVEQIYAYVMGAYFGGKEVPWTTAKAQKFIGKMRKHAAGNPEFRVSMDPTKHPEWKELPKEAQEVTKSLATETFLDPAEREAVLYDMANKLGYGDRIKDMPIEIEGFEVIPVTEQGQQRYRIPKTTLKKYKNWMYSSGYGEIAKIFAQEGSKVNIPTIHVLAPGGKKGAGMPGIEKPLSDLEVEAANVEMQKANTFLKRGITNLGKFELNNIRKGWFQVKNADSVYLVGEFESMKNDKNQIVPDKSRLKGASGWIHQFAKNKINPPKIINLFNPSSNRWYRLDYASDPVGFTEIRAKEVSKPTRNFVTFGQLDKGAGAPTSGTREAIEGFFKLHFGAKPKTKKVKIGKKGEVELSDSDIARIEELDKDYVRLEKQVATFTDALNDPNMKAKEKRKVETYVADLHEDIARNRREKFGLEQGRGEPLEDQRAKDAEDGKESDLDTDIGTRDIESLRVGKKAIQFVESHMPGEWDVGGALGMKTIQKAQTAAKVEDILKRYVNKGTEKGSPRNKSNEAIEAILNEFQGLKLTSEAKQDLRAWMHTKNQEKDVQLLSANAKDGKITVLDLNNPVTKAGQRKMVRDPEKLIEAVGREAGIPEQEAVYMVLDNISGREAGKGWVDYQLSRYRETLLNNKKINPNKDPKLAQELWDRQVTKYINQMHDKGYYLFGGRGDADRMIFVKHHPKTQQNGAYLKAALSLFAEKGTNFYVVAETDYVSKYGGNQVSEAKKKFAKAFESNLLYDVEMNGLEYSDPTSFRHALEKLKQDGFIGNAKALNKRQQIWFTNGIKADREFIYDRFLDSDSGKLRKDVTQEMVDNLGSNGELAYKITKDLPDSVRQRAEKDDKFYQWLDRKNSELEEHMDGSIIVHDKVIEMLLRDAGQSPDGGQLKSFIVNPHHKRGALLGKYMMHAAGAEQSKQMDADKVHMYIMDSAAKQRGTREYDKVYRDLEMENIRYSMSVKQTEHMLDAQKIPKQLLGSFLEHSFSPIEGDMIDGMFKDLIDVKFRGDPVWNKRLQEYSQKAIDQSVDTSAELNELTKKHNLEKIGIHELVKAMHLPNNEKFAHALWKHIMRVNAEAIEEGNASGESERNLNARRELAEFNTVADNIITRM